MFVFEYFAQGICLGGNSEPQADQLRKRGSEISEISAEFFRWSPDCLHAAADFALRYRIRKMNTQYNLVHKIRKIADEKLLRQ